MPRTDVEKEIFPLTNLENEVCNRGSLVDWGLLFYYFFFSPLFNAKQAETHNILSVCSSFWIRTLLCFKNLI